MREFSRKYMYMMIHREVLGLSWLPSTQHLNQDGGGGDEKSYLGRDFLVLNDCESLVQHPWLIKEPNVNDQGFISYVCDQNTWLLFMFELYMIASGVKPMIISFGMAPFSIQS